MPLLHKSGPVVKQMAQHGWLVRGGEAFTLSHCGSGLRLTVAGLKPDETVTLATSLAGILNTLPQKPSALSF